MVIVVDTSILIEEIRNDSEMWRRVKKDCFDNDEKILCPSIVLTELWAGKSMEKDSEKKFVEDIIEVINFIDVDEKLAKKAGEIIRNNKLSGFDAIIAATCILYEGKLATLNTKHFVGIKGLKLYKDENNSNKTENFVDLIKKFPKVKGLTVENYDKRYHKAMMKKHGRYLSKPKKNAKV